MEQRRKWHMATTSVGGVRACSAATLTIVHYEIDVKMTVGIHPTQFRKPEFKEILLYEVIMK